MSSLSYVASAVKQEGERLEHSCRSHVAQASGRHYGTLLGSSASNSTLSQSDERGGLPHEARKALVAQLDQPPRLSQVWASPNRVSIWSHTQPRPGQLTTGHVGHSAASTPKARGIRIVDTTAGGGALVSAGRSRWLGGAIAAHAPHPVGFRLALRVAHDLYAWEPVSPSEDFVALGQLFTTRAEPPHTASVRCIPRVWARAAYEPPRLLWAGPSADGDGDVCSMWLVNNLQHVAAATGTEPPSGAFYELREWPFALGELPAATEDEREGDPHFPAHHGPVGLDVRPDHGVSLHRFDAHDGRREPQWEFEPQRAHAWAGDVRGGAAGVYDDDDDDEML